MYRNTRKKLLLDNEEELDIYLSVSKENLEEAIALVYEERKLKETDIGETRILKKCHLPSLKAHSLCSAADIYSPEPSTAVELLEELRLSLLENNCSVSAILLKWLSQLSSRLFLPVMWKTAAVLFLNHYSFQGCHKEFLEACANQRLPEEERRLLKAIVSLPDVLESKTRKSLKQDPSRLNQQNLDGSGDEF